MGVINNEEIEYTELPKLKKLAVFMIALGPESSSLLLSQFEDEQIEQICREISSIQTVDSKTKQQSIDDFAQRIGENLGTILGGMNFAQKALEMSKHGSQAKNILGRIAPGGSTSDLINAVCSLDAMQIFNIFQNEQSQTLAFIMSNLKIEKAAELTGMLDEDRRQEVLEQVGDMSEAPIEMVAKIAEAIRPHLKEPDAFGGQKADGVMFVAEVLNSMDKEIGKNFLAKLGENNPDLSTAISKKMFSFEDLITVSVADLQRITREVEMNDLVVALKSASKQLEEAIMGSVSKRAAESLKDELSMLGPVKLSQVEEAQDRIIQVVKRLEEDGAIELGGSEGEVIE